MDSKQKLALQIAKAEVAEWRREEARAADGVALAKGSAIGTIRKAVKAGVPQATIAAECGWTRQRVHQLVTTGR